MLCAITNYKPNEPAEKLMQLNTIRPDMPELLKRHLRSLNEYAVNHNAAIEKPATWEDVERNAAQLRDKMNSVYRRELLELGRKAMEQAAEANIEADDTGVFQWDNGKWVII